MSKKQKKNNDKAQKLAEDWQTHPENSDVLGSYTGNTYDGNDKPTQDADDL